MIFTTTLFSLEYSWFQVKRQHTGDREVNPGERSHPNVALR